MTDYDYDIDDSSYEEENDNSFEDFGINLGIDSNGVPILPTVIKHTENEQSTESTIAYADAVQVNQVPVEEVREVENTLIQQEVESPIIAILNKANKEITSVNISTEIEIAPVSLLTTLRDTLDPEECESAFLSIIKSNIERNIDNIAKDILNTILKKTRGGTQKKIKTQVNIESPKTVEDDYTDVSSVED
jgi:hypothetical protein|nr:MAG TPA: hypothetical protein [Caudoviricetes sp.]